MSSSEPAVKMARRYFRKEVMWQPEDVWHRPYSSEKRALNACQSKREGEHKRKLNVVLPSEAGNGYYSNWRHALTG